MTGPPQDPRVLVAAERVVSGLRPPDDAAGDDRSPALERLEEIAGIARAFAALPDGGAPERPEPLFQWGPFEVRDRLGQGSFGEVYRAWEPGLDREVALKLRRGEGSRPQQLLAEARRLAQVRHPNVVVVHGAAIHDGRVGLWTDLVEGESLEQRLERDGRLAPSETAAIGLDLCRALAAVHGAGLVHGDLKAANVLRERGGRIVLADFGSASPAARAGEPVRLLTGTPAVLAPEVLAGAAPSAASDLYALGALLFRLLGGEYPRPGDGGGRERRMFDLRPDLPPPLVRLVARALERDPSARFTSAGEMAEALAATLAGPPRRRRTAALVVAATLLGAAALAFWLARRAGPQPAPAEARTSPSVGAVSKVNAAPEPPRIEAVLLRRRGDEIDRLGDGASVRPGDRLRLELSIDEPLHLYVLNEDEHGGLYLLFPISGLDQGNPVEPGAARALPGTLLGADQDWQVTSAGGTERFLVIASRGPNPELEARLGAIEPAAAGRFVALGPLAGDGVRGVGGLEPSGSASGSVEALDRIEALLADRPGLRLLRFELANPG